MPLNLYKEYPELLDLHPIDHSRREKSLMSIFKRDIEDNNNFCFREKAIAPYNKEGDEQMLRLFHHLTTTEDKGPKGNNSGKRSFEMDRSVRLHWVKTRINDSKNEGVEVFSYNDKKKKNRNDVIRTYILDTKEDYVVILEPRKTDYFLITAYYLNEEWGKSNIIKKLKKKEDKVS